MIPPTINVLLVEDVPFLARLTEQMLRKFFSNSQYSPVHTTTLAETLAAVAASEFDIILLDLNLPDSSGLSTVTSVIEATPEVPIVVLTANESPEDGLEAVRLGAQDYLVKGEFTYLNLGRAINYSIERHRLQRTIRQLAVIDELTGLYNRRGFNTLHPDILERVKNSDVRGYLCYFDLDRFKQINDVLGHQKGDEALVKFSACLRSVFRKDALLARLGGDEFLAMGVEPEPGHAAQALQSLEAMLAACNRKGDSPFALLASAGLTHFEKGGPLAMNELAALADAELYRNKENRHREAAASGLPPAERSC